MGSKTQNILCSVEKVDSRWNNSKHSSKSTWSFGYNKFSNVIPTYFTNIFNLSSNGIPLRPELLDERMRKDLEAAAVTEWFAGYLGMIPSCQN